MMTLGYLDFETLILVPVNFIFYPNPKPYPHQV